MYGVDCIDDIEDDFQQTLTECQQVTMESIAKEKIFVRLLGRIMRLIAPLL